MEVAAFFFLESERENLAYSLRAFFLGPSAAAGTRFRLPVERVRLLIFKARRHLFFS